MFRTNRLQRGFDSLESVVLLSTGVAAVSSSTQRDTRHGYRLELNGTLHGNKTVSISMPAFRCRRIRRSWVALSRISTRAAASVLWGRSADRSA